MALLSANNTRLEVKWPRIMGSPFLGVCSRVLRGLRVNGCAQDSNGLKRPRKMDYIGMNSEG
jgi:hypothetical protein